MAPTMDVDENDKAKDESPAKTTTKAARPKPTTNPSASSESAAVHPDMALAQDIHRLTMVRHGKLSADDAAAIAGCAPEALLERVMGRVGTGGKGLEEALKELEKRSLRDSAGQAQISDASFGVENLTDPSDRGSQSRKDKFLGMFSKKQEGVADVNKTSSFIETYFKNDTSMEQFIKLAEAAVGLM